MHKARLISVFLFLEEQGITVQFVPPCNHMQNLAKCAIQTCKNNTIAGLSGSCPSFPMILWDAFIPQANITINLLRNSKINPKLSDYAQMCGQFDCNRSTIAPQVAST